MEMIDNNKNERLIELGQGSI